MEAGAHVWCTDDAGDDAWLLAEVVQRTDEELHLQMVDKPEKKFVRKLDKDASSRKYVGVELANAKLSAEEKAEGMDDDLITLPHLHEPALLHTVSERFFEKKIYTWTGPVLIAVNPFQRFAIYTNVRANLVVRGTLSFVLPAPTLNRNRKYSNNIGVKACCGLRAWEMQSRSWDPTSTPWLTGPTDR